MPSIGATGVAGTVLSDDEQCRYEKFRKIDLPQFQGGKTKDEYEFLSTCCELLESVGLAESHGVRYVTLQMRRPARQWWRSYMSSKPVGSSVVTWEVFTQAFYDRFVPWSVRKKSRQQFERLS